MSITPGPWEAMKGKIWHIIEPQGGEVAAISPYGEFPGVNSEANARAIAAVPELVGLISELIGRLDELIIPELQEIYNRANDLLTRIEGEEVA